jgi:hypothetical protein
MTSTPSSPACEHTAVNYFFLLDRTPNAQPEEPRAWRKDEYPA